MHNNSYGNTGMSMIEILIGITIFAFAMLPIMFLGSSTTRSAHSVGKHMMASQIASSLIDKLLALPYDKCKEKLEELDGSGKLPLLEEEGFLSTLETCNEDIRHDMRVSFKHFQYSFNFDEDDEAMILRVNIEVFYRSSEGDPKTEHSISLSVLKFGERNE